MQIQRKRKPTLKLYLSFRCMYSNRANERKGKNSIEKKIPTHTYMHTSESCVVNGFWRKQSSWRWIAGTKEKICSATKGECETH